MRIHWSIIYFFQDGNGWIELDIQGKFVILKQQIVCCLFEFHPQK